MTHSCFICARQLMWHLIKSDLFIQKFELEGAVDHQLHFILLSNLTASWKMCMVSNLSMLWKTNYTLSCRVVWQPPEGCAWSRPWWTLPYYSLLFHSRLTNWSHKISLILMDNFYAHALMSLTFKWLIANNDIWLGTIFLSKNLNLNVLKTTNCTSSCLVVWQHHGRCAWL